MKKIILFLNFILLLLPAAIFGQQKIQSKLTDSKGKAIPYASVAITGTSLGTISNLNGNFELALPENKSDLTISISCIGYQTKVCIVDSLLQIQKQGKLPNLLLAQQHYQLQEVVVNKQEILKDAKQIFTKAIQELPNLLDDQPHIGKYYFRQSHRNKSSMNRLIEAAVSIYDPGISHKIEDCKFNIDELQSSFDNRNINYKDLLGFYQYFQNKRGIIKDSLLINTKSYNNPEVQKRLINAFDNNKASLSKFFTCTNIIRAAQLNKRRGSKKVNPWFENGGPFISKTFLKRHKFKLDTIIQYNGNPTYKVKILPSKNYLGLDGWEHKFMPIGVVYIRIKDFAFLSLDYGFVNNPNYKGYRFKGKRYDGFDGKFRYFYHFKLKFKDFNNKLYLSYLYSKRGDYINSMKKGGNKVIQEMVNTEIINDQSSISQQLKQKSWKGDHYEKLPYHKEFWDKYTTILPTFEQENLKKNLQQELLKK